MSDIKKINVEKVVKISDNDSLDYPVICDSCANANNALDIWIKFASYLNPEEVEFMKELEDKTISSISNADMNRYAKIRKQIEISQLLVKYKNKECTKKEHNKVVSFMHKSLRDFIRSRLTEKEQDRAINYILGLSLEDLKGYVKATEPMYDEISVSAAYSLFMAKEVIAEKEQLLFYERTIKEENTKNEHLRKNVMRDF